LGEFAKKSKGKKSSEKKTIAINSILMFSHEV
jgi:hypothetical protein